MGPTGNALSQIYIRWIRITNGPCSSKRWSSSGQVSRKADCRISVGAYILFVYISKRWSSSREVSIKTDFEILVGVYILYVYNISLLEHSSLVGRVPADHYWTTSCVSLMNTPHSNCQGSIPRTMSPLWDTSENTK